MRQKLVYALLLGIGLSWQLHGETVVVVVHPSNTTEISLEELSRLYLGRARTFSNGESAIPINLAENQAVRSVFDEKALSRSSAQLKAYWSKLVFTGKGSPPQEVDSYDEMAKLVATNPSIIGYLPASAADERVRIALRLE